MDEQKYFKENYGVDNIADANIEYMKNEADTIAKVAHWAFRQGWQERSRMQGISKKSLDKQYYDEIRKMLANKWYLKALYNPHLGKIYPPEK